MPRRENLRELILRAIRVLIFVDEDVLEAALVLLADVFVFFEQRHGDHQQVVEIERVVVAQLLLVDFIDVSGFFLEEAVSELLERMRPLQLVLRIRDGRKDASRRVLLLVEIELLERVFDDCLAVIRVVDDEIALVELCRLDLAAQEARAERMECAEPDVLCGIANHARGAVAHFRRGLVRERDGEDAVRRNAMRQEIRDAARQHFRLARASARHDEQRPFHVLDSLFLHEVESLEDIQKFPPNLSTLMSLILNGFAA